MKKYKIYVKKDGDRDDEENEEQDGEAQGAFGSRSVQARMVLGLDTGPTDGSDGHCRGAPAAGGRIRLLAPPLNQSPHSSRAHSSCSLFILEAASRLTRLIIFSRLELLLESRRHARHVSKVLINGSLRYAV